MLLSEKIDSSHLELLQGYNHVVCFVCFVKKSSLSEDWH